MGKEAESDTYLPRQAAPKCTADISDHTGYHFHRCNKPAKWKVESYGFRCGRHARGKYFESKRHSLSRSEQPNTATNL